jgi:hypothetical protein
VTAVDLHATVGDEALWRLVTVFGDGTPDWQGWLATLGAEVRARAEKALT